MVRARSSVQSRSLAHGNGFSLKNKGVVVLEKLKE